MATQANLRAIFDWLQFQTFSLDLEVITHNILNVPLLYFIQKKGRLEYYEYDSVLEYGDIRIYDYSTELQLSFIEKESGLRKDKMVVMSGKALTFYREEILAKQNCSFKNFLVNLFKNYEDKFKVTRTDPAIDDFNENPYFTPKQLLKICEQKHFSCGKSTFYEIYGTENKEKGMTLYLKPPTADDRIKFYDKQAEQAIKQGVRKKDMPKQIRTEIVFRREKAHEFIKYYVNQNIELIDLIKGHLKEKVKFYSDDFKSPLRKWDRFLGKTQPFKLSIPKENSNLYSKFEWIFYQGGFSTFIAYLFCLENGLFTYEELKQFEKIREKIEVFPPNLASDLIQQATIMERKDLIPLIKQMTKKPPKKIGDLEKLN
ncbi:replication initiation factor domain-containing protein [Enterococcus hirae]|uniref:replication initiation factor domain-containing protein n=1 Tax=Enterococcus hirae TaxID=1354 RepID=UPI001A96BED8|nr:replication initiation factor domain-containing protein [Enterococcus hirae]MBO1102633.1 replication initiation factor domain-containing protein [Enterococcus hirae]